jgi:hypothetical protein
VSSRGRRLLVCGLAVGLVAAGAGVALGFGISSPAFLHGQAIPKRYTCDGADVSPPLAWGPTPPGTRSVAVVVEDPEIPQGSWVHWVLYDLPAQATGVPERVVPKKVLPSGARQGINDFHRVGWGGPCPPTGRKHHYYLRVYALDAPLGLAPRATMVDVFNAMHDHVLSVAEMMATYER